MTEALLVNTSRAFSVLEYGSIAAQRSRILTRSNDAELLGLKSSMPQLPRLRSINPDASAKRLPGVFGKHWVQARPRGRLSRS